MAYIFEMGVGAKGGWGVGVVVGGVWGVLHSLPTMVKTVAITMPILTWL